MEWYYISLLLCLFGFLKEIRPSEPFVSDYMQYPYRNVTKEEVSGTHSIVFIHQLHNYFLQHSEYFVVES